MQQPSTHPDPAELVAYIDGDAASGVAEHVRECAVCAGEANGFGQTARRLGSVLYRFDCPDPMILGEYALELLDAERRRLVAAHTLECELCSGELRDLRQYLALEVSVPESLAGRVRRVVAKLLPAPGPGLALAGLRGSADDTTRVYEAGLARLSVMPTDEPGHLLGLLIDDGNLENRLARLISTTSSAVYETSVDGLGSFEFEGIPDGTYSLEVELSDGIAIVEKLQVR